MGVFATRNVGLTGPVTIPESAQYFVKAERFKGTLTNPNGYIPAEIGDEYLNTITGAEWQKISDNYGKTGWVVGVGGSSVTTIYATDIAYGATGDYSGDMTTAGTGTDNRALIQAALDAAHVQGASYGDTTKGSNWRVVLPRGKYYISAPTDGSPSLKVPLGVVFDFSEAELHLQIPPRTYTANGITEPNPDWCGIYVGPMAGLILGKMQTKHGQDQTYGGNWYGMHLDAVRVVESDLSYITGGNRGHHIFNFRGAGIRYVASINAWLESVSVASCCYGVVMGYYGTAFNYTRYRTGGTNSESVSTSLWIDKCNFVNMYKMGVRVGVANDWKTPALGSLEEVNIAYLLNGGPIVITNSGFENVNHDSVFAYSQSSLIVENCRFEEVGDIGGGFINASGVISGSAAVKFFLVKGCTFGITGARNIFKASYTGPLTTGVCNPRNLTFLSSTDVAPVLENVYVNNTASSDCQWVHGSVNVTRLPILINPKAAASTQMQRTSTYMKSIIVPNGGGRIWSIATVGILADQTPNGALTTFTFSNGFTRQKPERILVDGQILEETDVAGTNWTWQAGTTDVLFAVAPTKKVRAFF